MTSYDEILKKYFDDKTAIKKKIEIDNIEEYINISDSDRSIITDVIETSLKAVIKYDTLFSEYKTKQSNQSINTIYISLASRNSNFLNIQEEHNKKRIYIIVRNRDSEENKTKLLDIHKLLTEFITESQKIKNGIVVYQKKLYAFNTKNQRIDTDEIATYQEILLTIFNADTSEENVSDETRAKITALQERYKNIDIVYILQNMMNIEYDKLIKYNKLYYIISEYIVTLIDLSITELQQLHRGYINTLVNLEIDSKKENEFRNVKKYLKYKTKYLALS